MKSSDIVNNLRIVSCETISNAGSGHPGVALSGAPIFYAIFKNLKIDRNNLKYFNRDYFVNSAGHSSSLHYSILNLFDINITKNDLMHFRKLNSKTPGHPEIETSGIDCSTGPLGEGVACSVGLAISQKHFAKMFNKPSFEIFSSSVFCFVGDGCLMEGVSAEALSLAGKLKLNNLIVLYDRNRKTIEGSLDITQDENTELKFKALNFNVINVKDGNNADLIEKAIFKAKRSKDKPSIIIVDTKIGFGSHLEDNELSHGKPFKEDEILYLKNKFNINNLPFEFLPEIKEYIKGLNYQKDSVIKEEYQKLNEYKLKYPQEFENLEKYFNFDFNKLAIKKLKSLDVKNIKSTRENNHYALNEIAKLVPNLIGGSADVCSSTMVFLDNEKFINEDYTARNIHFGIREHAMAGICNGMALFGGLLPFCSCYLSFSDFLKPALRMSCLMDLPIIYEFSHDNVFVGEDGPTHQPIEQLVSLRATPNLHVFRPYNLTEILACYKYYLENKKPTALILSKEKVTNNKTNLDDAMLGGYIIYKEKGKLKGVILSSGMEVETAIKVAESLDGIRVVSITCFELFDEQPKAYRNKILTDKPKIVMELSSSYSYYKYASNGLYFTTDKFGKSGSSTELREFYGFTPEKIIKKVKKFLKIE